MSGRDRDGTKFRIYCTGPTSIRYDIYSTYNEDPWCTIPYPDINSGIEDLRSRSMDFEDGKCVQTSHKDSIKLKIRLNSNPQSPSAVSANSNQDKSYNGYSTYEEFLDNSPAADTCKV